ncbi:MAG: spermidine/putrescine ABC transporter substrate-binding protein [Solirubrobacteraceae bacterium]|jgi:spermidine/putrescine transport system substrate-binding protein|nr:spermidine/putrescine ABC transporter substrate-binding protein [Solirubrobacteraceae bacterium]MDP4920842.1 spermidine/putrescine ABC transporter substrate-binding protein [Solirubrobacteraceae bacterium]MDP5033647.1 spermidine/putrescine ABC transporter substrate-binding protein [Solirubrobacteraceae bacterium]
MPDESLDHFFDRLVSGEPISRRSVLRRMAASGIAVGSASAFLAACGGVEGTSSNQETVDTSNVNHPKAPIGTLVFSNWPLYIDEKVIPGWEKANDAKMRYLEDYNDNEEFYAKVRQELEQGQGIGRDLVAPTDWMAGRWIDQGYAIPIDKKNVPNGKNLLPSLQNPPFDKNRDFTLPWQSGITGIGYDPKKTGRKLNSINDLFDPAFKGRVSMFSEWRDSAGLVMLGQGVDASKATKAQCSAAIEKINVENEKGQIRRFTGNDYTKDLAAGNLWACVAWSGDLVQLQADNPSLEFLVPDEGGMSWSDNMLIPQGAKTPYGAETFMNYVYDPEAAGVIAEYVNYFCPVDGVQELVAKKNPELAKNQLIFPDQATLDKLYGYPSLSAADERELTAQMQKVTGA